MSGSHRTSSADRIALAVGEARLEHGLSVRRLAALSGVSATTIRKVERGGCVDPALLVRLGATLVVLGMYRPPRFDCHVEALLAPVTQQPWAA